MDKLREYISFEKIYKYHKTKILSAVFIVLIFFLNFISITLTKFSNFEIPLWILGEGASLAFAILYGKKLWPAVFIGQILFAIVFTGNFIFSLSVTTVLTLEYIVASIVLKKYKVENIGLKSYLKLIIFSVFLFQMIVVLGVDLSVKFFGGVELKGFRVLDTLMLNGFSQPLIAYIFLITKNNFEQKKAVFIPYISVIGVNIFCFFIISYILQNSYLPIYLLITIYLVAMFSTIFFDVLGGGIASLVITIIMKYILYDDIVTYLGIYDFSSERIQIILTNILALLYLLSGVFGVVLRENRRNENELKEKNIELDTMKKNAEKRDYEKSVFLANMSHEIRTPLNVIIGFADLLENGIIDDNEITEDIVENIKEAVNYISISSKKLSEMIENIIDLSKIEAGKMELEKEEVDLKLIIKNIIYVNNINAKKKNINLKAEISKEIPEMIISDRNKLNHIIVNILSNAVKFTEKGGMIKLKVEKVDEFIRVEVKDQGIGISEKDQELIFQPFQQGKTKAKSQGTGLGLSIVKKMIELMGGDIRVESQFGDGSKFIFKFPYEEVERKEYDMESIKNIKFSEDSMVLIVEDDEINQKMMKKFLSNLHIRNEIVSSGEECFKILDDLEENKSLPDIIFMDIRLPDMDGLEISRVLLKNDYKKELNIVIFTADVLMEKREEAFKSGVKDFLTKPLDVDKFIRVLKEYLKWEMKNEKNDEISYF